MAGIEENVRLDKWLWVARFFKTRSLAAQAVNGGKVHVNGSRAKSGRIVTVGDSIKISKGDLEFDITVTGLSKIRGPAVAAQLLYEELPESCEKRNEKIALKKMLHSGSTFPVARPTKRDRRKIIAFTRGQSGGEHEED